MATKTTTATATDKGAAHLFLSHVALSDIKFGHDLKGAAGAPRTGVNARKTTDPAQVKTLAKSIGEVGLLVPLTVMQPDRSKSTWFVVDGNTRLAAIQSLHKPADWPGVLVPTFEPADGANGVQALELSMIANSERTDLHPVERFEVFEQMVKGGSTIEDIGRRYMLKPAQVRQALALAAMAPEIRQAWRDGKIDGEAAEAYAQTPDLEHQVRVFKKLRGRTDAWAINREITGDNHVGSMLKFVGRPDYEKAGHHINESLFADDDRQGVTVSNLPALRALADKKIEAEIERLKADGWGWAIARTEAPRDIYAWRRTPANPTKDVKAAAGCTVEMDHAGVLKVERGYIKPGTSVVIPKSPAEKKLAQLKLNKRKEAGGGITQGLAWRLSQQLTRAAYEALRTDGQLGLKIAIASMATEDGPGQIRLAGMDELEGDDREDNEFAKYFAMLAGKGAGELLELLAEWTARSLSLVAHSAEHLPFAKDAQPGGAILLNALRPPALKKALLAAFDRKDYFGSISREQIRVALIDCGGLALAARCSTMKKAGIVAFAIENVGRDWLPPEMRTRHYDGPAAPKAKAKTAAKAKPKKKVRR